jgi:SAM-dependent methyltransferase
MSDTVLLEPYFRTTSATGVYPNSRNLRFYLGYLFDGVDFVGKRMLDIGAGSGLYGIYAACSGATQSICLEPEAAGSVSGVRQKFDRVVGELALNCVSMSAATLQEFEPGTEGFDLVFLHNSINHLDESACMALHRDDSAQRLYLEVFRKMHALTAPGGTLIIADCARRNLFGDLGLKNPLAPMIEWHKHQSPRLWARLLGEVGFARPRIRWSSYNSLGRLGRILLGHRAAAYCLNSHFCLTMQKM